MKAYEECWRLGSTETFLFKTVDDRISKQLWFPTSQLNKRYSGTSSIKI